ncbi:MAG: hypothetical protein AABY22_15960, partial [Nanoarchaeota archaeon]
MDFKYTTIFAAEGKIKAFKPEGKLSVASLVEISKYLPKNIDLTENPDLLAVSFAGAVANMVNLNDDGITGVNLVEIAKNFVGKLIDIDHNRKRVCGHITNYAFTKFGTDEP